MTDHHRASLPPDALFVIACPTCFGHVAAPAGMAGRPGCCPLCASAFEVPEPRLNVAPTPPAPAREIAPEPPPQPAPAAEPAAPAASPAAVVEPEPVPAAAAEAQPAATFSSEPVAEPTASPVDASGFQFREPVKVVGRGPTAIQLRRLTDEERRVRRGRRNIIFLLVGAALLIVLTLVLGTPRRRR
jgi:hypothetical protein